MALASLGQEVLGALMAGKKPNELYADYSTATVAKYNKVWVLLQEIEKKQRDLVMMLI